MLKRNQLVALLALLFTLFMLAACGGGTDEDTSTEAESDDAEVTEEAEEEASGEPQQGGTITGAMHTAPAGQFNPLFYEEAYEDNILSFTHNHLFSQNNELEFEPSKRMGVE